MAVSQDSLPIVIARQRTTVNQSDDDDGGSTGYTCNKKRIACGSCSKVIICNHLEENVASYECSSVDPLRPYCTGDGVCASDTECEIPSELCPTNEYFYPVPSNCSEVVYCGDKLEATKYVAPSSSYVFDFASQKWVVRKTAADCFQINCATSTMMNKFFAYKPNPQLYFYCATSGPMTFTCKDNEVFNEAKRLCEFGCTKEGDFPIPGVDNRYYACLLGPNGLVRNFDR
uniref:Chitin-binding type-2 domain-containing protein n=1 Tax=Anopheles maculatus TaxID=74869 RepID=A0A182SN68_9DIPT